MSDETAKKLGIAVIGLIAGGLLVFGALKMLPQGDEDEERPPIIVKNGSLIFQSGVDKDRPGKPWFEDADGEWKQYHPSGQPTNVFRLDFEASGTCRQVHVQEFVIGFDPDGSGAQSEVQFVVSGKPRDMGRSTGSPGPAVEGKDLDNRNNRPTPTLTYPTTSAGIMRILRKNGQTLCDNVKQVTAQPLQ